MREFTKQIQLLATELDVDGRSLPRERPGPLHLPADLPICRYFAKSN
jgi:hypothetical protein